MALLDTGDGSLLAIDDGGLSTPGLLITWMMALGWPNRIDECTLAGGTWSAEFPRSNLLRRQFSRRARTTSTADTTIQCTLPKWRPIRVIAIDAHNLSVVAQWRVKIYYDAERTSLLWDSGWQDVWPRVYDSLDLPWEADNWWAGTLSDDERATYRMPAKLLADAEYVCRAVDVTISDAANADGYLELGRILIAPVWQPQVPHDLGSQQMIIDLSSIDSARDGTEYYDEGVRKRAEVLDLSALGEAEAIRQLRLMQRVLGTTGELLFMPNLLPAAETSMRTFIGRLAELSPITHPNIPSWATSLHIQEIT